MNIFRVFNFATVIRKKFAPHGKEKSVLKILRIRYMVIQLPYIERNLLSENPYITLSNGVKYLRNYKQFYRCIAWRSDC
jgi:hypothetical protein